MRARADTAIALKARQPFKRQREGWRVSWFVLLNILDSKCKKKKIGPGPCKIGENDYKFKQNGLWSSVHKFLLWFQNKLFTEIVCVCV